MLGFTSQVLSQDVDSQYGIAHSPIGPSPSQSPLAFRPFGSAPSGPPSAYSSALARTASASNNSNMATTTLTGSASGSGNISRLSKSTSSSEAPGPSGGVTGVSSGEPPKEGDSPAEGLLSLPEGDQGQQCTASSASDADSLLGSDASALPLSTEGTGALSQPDTATAVPPRDAVQGAALLSNQASTSDTRSQTGQLSTTGDPAAVTSAGVQAADTAPALAAAPNKAELQQSMEAVLSGEDQAMKESLAAANAAGGERVGDLLTSNSSGLPQQPAVEASPSHDPSPDDEATAPLVEAALAEENGPRAGASGEEEQAGLGSLLQQSETEPADEPALHRSGSSGHIAERYRSATLSVLLCWSFRCRSWAEPTLLPASLARKPSPPPAHLAPPPLPSDPTHMPELSFMLQLTRAFLLATVEHLVQDQSLLGFHARQSAATTKQNFCARLQAVSAVVHSLQTA